MSKGKPSGSEKRERGLRVDFRVTEAEAAEIDAAATKAGFTTRGAYLRSQSLSAPRQRRGSSVNVAVLSKTLAQLGKCGSNLNQIAHKLNADEIVLRPTIAAAVDELRTIGAAIMEALGRGSRGDRH